MHSFWGSFFSKSKACFKDVCHRDAGVLDEFKYVNVGWLCDVEHVSFCKKDGKLFGSFAVFVKKGEGAARRQESFG